MGKLKTVGIWLGLAVATVAIVFMVKTDYRVSNLQSDIAGLMGSQQPAAGPYAETTKVATFSCAEVLAAHGDLGSVVSITILQGIRSPDFNAWTDTFICTFERGQTIPYMITYDKDRNVVNVQ